MIPSISSAYEPLDLNYIARKAPAIMATKPYEEYGNRYAFIPTSDLLNAMVEHDFLPFSVHQSKSRVAERSGFTKHAICFRHVSTFDNMKNDIVPQVVILNSHDRTSAYKIYFGMFRFVCSNGLIIGNTINAFSVRHAGHDKTIDNIIDASFKVLNETKHVMEVVDDWKNVELNRKQRLDLAHAAYEIKFGEKSTPINPEDFLVARNYEDGYSNSLWTTFNTVQENLIKGGLTGYRNASRTRRHERLRITTRSINNINQNVDFNTRLWNAASEIRQSIGY